MAQIITLSVKWLKSEKTKGHENMITLADGSLINGTYYVTESGNFFPSHDILNGFSLTDGFPTDENGNTLNDRDYQFDVDAQQITRYIAENYDSRAIQTPIIISGDGIVLSGNGRTMAGILAAKNNTDTKYIDYLKKFGNAFGFSPSDIDKYEHPRLVFVLSENLPYNATTFARFNQSEMKSQSKTELAIKYGKLVGDDVFKRIISTINSFETLSDFYGCTEAATDCINDLLKNSVLDRMSYSQMFDGDTISVYGRELLENILIGKAFANYPECVRMLTTYKSLRKSIVFGLSEIANNLCFSDDYTLNSELLEAIKLAYIARQNGYKSGERVSEYSRQKDAFTDTTICDYKDTCILVLADALNNEKVSLLKKIFAVYNHQAKDADEGQTDIFSATGVKTKKEILEEVRALFAKADTRKEAKEAEETAINARMSDNVFISSEMATKVVKGGYVEFLCKSGDVVVLQVEAIKRGIVYLIGKGGIKLWCNLSEVTPTANHNLNLPEWLRSGEVITDEKNVSQRIAAVTDNFVIFEWINGGLFEVNITTILQTFVPSKDGKIEIIENV